MGLLDAGVAVLLMSISCSLGAGAAFRVGVSVKPVASKPWVASGTPAVEIGATMPPAPGVKVTVPPLPFNAVSAPEPSSRMIWPGPTGFWTTRVDCASGGGRRDGRECDVPSLGTVAHDQRAGGSRLDLGQLGVRQVDAVHRVIRAALCMRYPEETAFPNKERGH